MSRKPAATKNPSPEATEPAGVTLTLPVQITIAHGIQGQFIATFGGRTVAADSLEELFEAVYAVFEDEDDLRAAANARAELVREGAISWDQVKSELGL